MKDKGWYPMQDDLNFKPPWWLRNKHVQSVYASLIPKQSAIKIRWEEMNLSDGDFIDLAWAGPIDAPIVILLHGVEGSLKSHYIQEMLENLVSRGWQVVVMHYRGCSGRINRLPQFYNAGDTTGDLKALVDMLHTRHPHLPLFAIGFSLGGNVLMRHLALNTDSPLVAGVGVSMPYELGKSSDYLIPFYQRIILRSLKRKFELKFEAGIEMPVSRDHFRNMTTLRQFDSIVSVPMFDYNSVDEYYEDVSNRHLLQKINHPTLIFHAMDDPFVPQNSVPTAKELSENTQFEISENGGHMGFLRGGLPWRPTYWLTQKIQDFFAERAGVSFFPDQEEGEQQVAI